MRTLAHSLVILVASLWAGCTNVKKPVERPVIKTEVYRWIIFESISRSPKGLVVGKPTWDTPSLIKTLAKELPGWIFTYYLTPDRKTLLQLHYTNPGNMMGAILYSKEGTNILEKDGIVPDPRDEIAEPERGM